MGFVLGTCKMKYVNRKVLAEEMELLMDYYC